MPAKMKTNIVRYFARNLCVVAGIVLIWRGIWYILDALDIWLFGGNRLATAVPGIILGFLLLYIPDRNLKEIEKL